MHLNEDSRNNFWYGIEFSREHYSDVIMSAMASQITSFTIVCSTV